MGKNARAKTGGKIKKKEYVLLQPQIGVKPEKIKVIIDDGATIAYFSRVNDILYINQNYVDAFISEGIIAEKKSKSETIKDDIIAEFEKLEYSNGFIKEMSKVILDVLEKAGIE